ncbi:MAG: efflux RND transporter periplasmic adaptor subunit, partial [Planctomycetes bacterium]|nr:efflux RND transporter periplasmic adaptor subunit [Planctomycetota bacterium]
LPETALARRESGSGVFTLDGDRAHWIPLGQVERLGNQIVVPEGELREGDRVILLPPSDLSEGDRVLISTP